MKRGLAELEGAYLGRTLLVVSCGPSAAKWRQVRARLPGDTVIGCVKQAIFLCGGDAAIHFFNAFNCQRYFPHNRTALKVYVEDEQSPVNFNAADFTFSLDPRTCTSLEASVAGTGKFEDYTIAKSGLVKPWGPGIIYEIVVYFALHLGFREIHTVGWDVARETPAAEGEPVRLEHFYDLRRVPSRPPQIDYEWLQARPSIYAARAFARHLAGRTYNRMPKADKGGEIPVIVRSLPRFFDWVESQGSSLTVHTDLTGRSIDESVRRRVVDVVASR